MKITLPASLVASGRYEEFAQGPGKRHGRSNSLKWPWLYDKLRAKGYDKSKAAAISNAKIHTRKKGRLSVLPAKSAHNRAVLKRLAAADRRGKHSTKGSLTAAASASEVERDNLWPQSGSRHTSQGRWFRRDGEFGFNPNQPRDKTGKWTTKGRSYKSVKATDAKRQYMTDRGIGPDTHDYSTVVAPAAFRRRVAKMYANLPSDDPAAHRAYEALRSKVRDQYEYMTKKLGIKVTVTPDDPYPNIDAMMADIETGNLKVLATASTPPPHPYFSNAENDMFRAVHDFYGHAATGRDFNRHGERATFLSHARTFGDDKDAIRALFTETEAQNAYAIANQQFGEQKVSLLPDEMVFYGLN